MTNTTRHLHTSRDEKTLCDFCAASEGHKITFTFSNGSAKAKATELKSQLEAAGHEVTISRKAPCHTPSRYDYTVMVTSEVEMPLNLS